MLSNSRYTGDHFVSNNVDLSFLFREFRRICFCFYLGAGDLNSVVFTDISIPLKLLHGKIHRYETVFAGAGMFVINSRL